MAEITWLGHSCFRIRGREAVVVTDPLDLDRDVAPSNLNGDIVTFSHDPSLPSAPDLSAFTGKVICGPGEYEIRDIFVRGIRTYRENKDGGERVRNTVYLFEMEDLTICHLGDLSQGLTEDQSAGISSVDVLIVPVGGGLTLDATAAAELVGQIEPSMVIPMQYRTERGDFDRDPLEPFLKKFGITDIEMQDKVTVKKGDLSESVQVVVLKAAG